MKTELILPKNEQETENDRIEIVIQITGWQGDKDFYTSERRLGPEVMGNPDVQKAIQVIDSAMQAASMAAKLEG